MGVWKKLYLKDCLQHTSTKVSFSQILLPRKKCLSINLRCFPFLAQNLFCGCSISLLCQHEWFNNVSFFVKKNFDKLNIGIIGNLFQNWAGREGYTLPLWQPLLVWQSVRLALTFYQSIQFSLFWIFLHIWSQHSEDFNHKMCTFEILEKNTV